MILYNLLKISNFEGLLSLELNMIGLTNSIIRTVKSLDERKHRRKENAFKAEGTKCVLDTLQYFNLNYLLVTEDWLHQHSSEISKLGIDNGKIIVCSRSEICKMSSLVTPADVVAVYSTPHYELRPDAATKNLVVALDSIQDPGNLGTIIRVSDWFGVKDIICNVGTADCFSPKVIQATMGSIARVRLHYGNLPEIIQSLGEVNVYGTFLDGVNISSIKLSRFGVIVIGNEGNGISPEVEKCVTSRLLIPSYPPGEPTGESLNAAVATAITLAKFRNI